MSASESSGRSKRALTAYTKSLNGASVVGTSRLRLRR